MNYPKRGIVVLLSLALLTLFFGAERSVQAAPTELFFSEYIEGSSNNKALEIYNGTGAAIDLAAGGYNVVMYFNGNSTIGLTINLAGSVADDDVFVLAQSTADALILAQADQTNGSGWFNGDDAVALRKGTTIIDVIGEIGFDPGAEWGSGVTSTADNTLRRKGSIQAGDADGSNDFDPAVEWDGFTQNTFDGLGSHTLEGGGPADPAINEFVMDHTGADTHEFVELLGDPAADYSAFTLLEIEGDGAGTGVIDGVLAVGTTDAGGFWTTGFRANEFENGTLSLLLVEDFTGSTGTDLDPNNDGAFDVVPWARLVDDVAIFDGGVGDQTYATTDLASGFDGVAPHPGGASRLPDGQDNESPSDWLRNDFDGAGLPGFTGTPVFGEAFNTPGASNEAVPDEPIEACGDPATLIHAIQGGGLASPLPANTSVAIEGVVVGDYQTTSGLRGFFVQEEDGQADADPSTSEGIFVFEGNSNVPVNPGDVVRVRGEAVEFSDLTELTNISVILVCSSGAGVTPTPVTLPVANITDLERYEGMLVSLSQELTVTENFTLGRFGEVHLSVGGRLFIPTHLASPGAAAIAQQDLNNRSRILLDDGNGQQNIDPTLHPPGGLSAANTLRAGYTVNGLTGVLDERFDLYRIQPVGPVNFTASNPRPAAPNDVEGTLKVGSFNVLNYFTTLDTGAPVCGPANNQDCRGANTPAEFTRQRDKIINALVALDADVVGLMEMENNPSAAIQDLVNGLNSVAGAGTYDFIDTGLIGTDAIKVALIYQPAAVSPAGSFAILDSSVDPLFDDTKNRPALAQTFEQLANGQRFTVVVNHLKSKGSDCNDVGDPDTGDGQGNCNVTRTRAATALVNWLAGDPTGSGDPDFLIIGDLNSYAKEDPITTIKNAGYINLLESFLGDAAYSFVFGGQSGYLDHALANASLTSQVSGATEWHINADEPIALDYNVEFKTPNHVNTLYAPTPYRAADHDPVLVGLCQPPALNVTVSPDTLWPPNHKYVEINATVQASADTDSVELLSVTSNEPDSGQGGGDKPNDIVIVDDLTVKLRAERAGKGDGRVYTFVYEATTVCGSATQAMATVIVPHSQGKGKENDITVTKPDEEKVPPDVQQDDPAPADEQPASNDEDQDTGNNQSLPDEDDSDGDGSQNDTIIEGDEEAGEGQDTGDEGQNDTVIEEDEEAGEGNSEENTGEGQQAEPIEEDEAEPAGENPADSEQNNAGGQG